MVYIEKLKGEMNPKIARKIVKYLNRGIFSDSLEEEYSDIFKIRLDSFLNFLKQKLTMDTIIEVSKFFNIDIKNQELLQSILEVNKINEFDKLANWFIEKYKIKLYKNNTLFILNLFINHWLYNKGYSLISLYPSFMLGFDELIKLGDNDVLKEMLYNFYNDSLITNTVSVVKTKDELVEKILELKDILILQFDVKKLYMFGSYSKGYQSKFSDLDLAVKFRTSKTKFQIKAMDDFLTAILKLKVNSITKTSFVENGLFKVF